MRIKNKKRKIISLCILLSGVVVSFIIINSGSQTQKGKNTEPIITAKGTVNPQLDFFIQPLPNLTDEFANKSLEKLVKDNEGKISQGIKDPKQLTLLPKKNDVEKIISDLIDNEFYSEKVSQSEIYINTNNSKELQSVYILFVNYLLKKNEGEIASIQGSEGKTFQERFALTANRFGKTAEMLKEISVPPSWIDIHMQLIEFFIRQKNIYSSLSYAEQDPLRFIIAIRRISGDSEDEFAIIKNQIEKRIKEEKLISA